jgi:hypothetical protein
MLHYSVRQNQPVSNGNNGNNGNNSWNSLPTF